MIDHVADALWEPDGTEPPPAPTAWDDPVAGLVTGAYFESEPFQIEVVTPPEPDMDEVRKAVDAVLAGEEEQTTAPQIPSPRRRPAPSDTPGFVAPNPRPGWPRTPPLRQLPGLRPRQLPAPPPPPRRGQVRRSQVLSAGTGVIVVIVAVVLVIVVTIIGSLVNMISALFN
jgi:hypothetical protein